MTSSGWMNWKNKRRRVFVLDNDTLTLFFQNTQVVVRRVLSTPDEDVWLPAAAVEEQLRGRLAAISVLNTARVSDRAKIPLAYDLLLETVRRLQQFQHLSYTAEMEDLYQSWPPAVKRLGTRDCRIAATAVVHGFTVVTRNLGHFQPIPGVQSEDWSR